ncbi:MAG: 2-hydroxyglutaryl-CoA dehydratase, partial [Polyangiaceae bacterium]
ETDKALEKAKQNCYDALLKNQGILHALWKSKPLFDAVKVDRMRPIPKVSIIGEFWAMTTEGDGNYQLQRFLEGEGAECDIQLVTAWILYTIWEVQNDTKDRMFLNDQDKAKYGLAGSGAFGAMKTLISVNAAEYVVRGLFQVFAHAGGLYGYKLPDMKKMAEISHEYYNNDLRGGEGHMEVGKLIMNVLGAKAHMTLSVKPFGCMPSAGVSDGVQSAISEKFPGTIFCPVETSGDGRVNFYSRVQMYLFKAKQAAVAEYERALEEHGVTREEVRTFLEANPKFNRSLHKPEHAYAGICADIVAEIAPYITKTPMERLRERLTGTAKKSLDFAQKSPHLVVELVGSAVREAPVVARKLREDVLAFRDERAAKKKNASQDQNAMAHAAE